VTCAIKTRSAAPSLLLDLRLAEENARSIEDSMHWARSNGHGVLADVLWRRLLAANDAVRAADHAHWMATRGEG